eukprot:11205367-Lingulodinium_polyedra.AAC.1
MPEAAAVVPLAPWLSPKTAAAWDAAPAALREGEDLPKAYFAASQKEWRAAVRRMARCGLAVPISANAAPAGLSAGAFAVRKDAQKDRLIGDRR